MTLCLYSTQSGSPSPHSSQTPFLILIIADAWPRAGAGDQGVPQFSLELCAFGDDENSCLGLQGLSPSYFHPQHRGRNSSEPGGERGEGLTKG